MNEPVVSAPRRRPKVRFTVQDGLVVGLAAVVIAQTCLFIRMERGRPPQIVTVGVRQITQEYVARLATSNVSQEEARIRTELYLAVAQDTIARMSVEEGVLVVARECVLAGEHADLTAQASKAVQTAFARATATGGGARVR